MRKFLFMTMLLAAINMQAQENENTLWYLQAAKDWNEALPVGNGRIGAMVYGDTWYETIQLNEESLWAGTQQDGNAASASRIGAIKQLLLDGNIEEANTLANQILAGDPMRIRSYQSFGDLHIDFFERGSNGEKAFFKDGVKDYKRSLDIINGIATTRFTANGIDFKRDVFASAPDNILVVRLTASKPGALTFRLSYTREKDASAIAVNDNTLDITGQIIDMPDKVCGEAGPHMKFGG